MLPIIYKCRYYTTAIHLSNFQWRFFSSFFFFFHSSSLPFSLSSSAASPNDHCNNTISNDNDNGVGENACIATNTVPAVTASSIFIMSATPAPAVPDVLVTMTGQQTGGLLNAVCSEKNNKHTRRVSHIQPHISGSCFTAIYSYK